MPNIDLLLSIDMVVSVGSHETVNWKRLIAFRINQEINTIFDLKIV